MKKPILTLLVTLLYFFSNSQTILINEFSQGESGNKEYVELLVIGQEKCSVVDIRSWVVDDNNGDFGSSNINRGHIKFTEDILWSRILSGTMIILYNAEDTSLALKSFGTLLDTDPNDFLIVLPVGCVGTPVQCPTSLLITSVSNIPTVTNSSYNIPFTTIAPTFKWNTVLPFNNTSDAIQLRRQDGTFVHGISWGNINLLHPDLVVYGTNRLWFNTAANTYSLTNQYSYDFKDKRNWTASTIKSPGIPNSLQNQEFVNNYKVDNDCVLAIKDILKPNSIEDVKVRYYSMLGQLIEAIEYNRVIIKETTYPSGEIVREKIVILK